jgi:hypothetical protein
MVLNACDCMSSFNDALRAGVATRQRQIQPASQQLEASVTAIQTVFTAFGDMPELFKQQKNKVQRNDAFRIAKAALTLLFGAGHEVLAEVLPQQRTHPSATHDRYLPASSRLLINSLSGLTSWAAASPW